MSFSVEIENAALEWIDVTGLIEELTDGTGDADQVIPEITIQFKKRPPDPDLCNPSINKWRARIRVTEDGAATYYLMERPQGDIVQSLDNNSLYGRAWAGVLDNLRPASFEWTVDTPASVICAQVAHQDVTNQSGITVPVSWQASIDPTIPGGRYSISRVSRREVIAAVAEACGAKVRASLDGLGLEVYDVPPKDGSGAVVRRYLDGIAPLNYECRRQFEIANAVRVQGEKLNYTSARLPSIQVQVIPGAIAADGVSTATARARVFDASGRPVQHSALVDEPIAAGSYTDIPVSGCFSVQGVWLNTGTREAPVKGAKVTPTNVTASVISVPAQATQLFIVSYTQAVAVSWSAADTQKQIDGEARATTGAQAVSTTQPIGRVRGVYRATDKTRSGTNYYTGGSATPNTTAITLGITPGPAGTAVIIDYDIYEATPAVNLSPTSSLCDSDGFATTTVGAGSTLGLMQIIASALGQSGSAPLSLTGDAVGSLRVTADPQVIRAKQTGAPAPALVLDEAQQIQTTSEQGYPEYYIEVSRKVSSVQQLRAGAGTANVARWENRDTSYRIYLFGTWSVGVWAAADYYGWEVIDEADQESRITATVLTSAGAAVTDGTAVKFELDGHTNGASLSSSQEYTSGGEASVTLTAGDVAEFYVWVTAGPFRAQVLIRVVDHPLASEQTPGTANGTYSSGSDSKWSWEDLEKGEYRKGGRICKQVPKDGHEESGSITGCRQVIGCENEPLKRKKVEMCGKIFTTDDDGYFCFDCGLEGSNQVSVDDTVASFDIAPAGSESRWDGMIGSDKTYEVCRDDD